jgi:hypothetical protein
VVSQLSLRRAVEREVGRAPDAACSACRSARISSAVRGVFPLAGIDPIERPASGASAPPSLRAWPLTVRFNLIQPARKVSPPEV